MGNENLTRRDWFRLRVPRENRMLGEDDNSSACKVLQPITPPPNHDGMDLSQLPPMREAFLDHDQIGQLFTDIRCLATEIHFMHRSVGSTRANAESANSPERLEFAKTALLTGKISRLQIRYRWQNAFWIDTLTIRDEGIQLIRIQHTAI